MSVRFLCVQEHVALASVLSRTIFNPNRVCVCLCGQVHRSVMPSHTVYALNVERILARLWHPSHEELEQDNIHRQRLAAKEGLLLC